MNYINCRNRSTVNTRGFTAATTASPAYDTTSELVTVPLLVLETSRTLGIVGAPGLEEPRVRDWASPMLAGGFGVVVREHGPWQSVTVKIVVVWPLTTDVSVVVRRLGASEEPSGVLCVPSGERVVVDATDFVLGEVGVMSDTEGWTLVVPLPNGTEETGVLYEVDVLEFVELGVSLD